MNFAINYNKKIANEIDKTYYICNELGGITSFNDNDYYNLVIFVDVDIKDPDIKELVDHLPNFKKIF